ncbi:MAG: hypothetical protein LUD41_02215 [Phascolarctobacterium sp.]|nr:hypothetical protein [Phascolarctobacterium sp.]
MFKIKNERLYPDLKPMCLSFEIPEGFWIDPCTEVVKPNFIFFRTADKTVSVEITFTYKTVTPPRRKSSIRWIAAPRKIWMDLIQST